MLRYLANAVAIIAGLIAGGWGFHLFAAWWCGAGEGAERLRVTGLSLAFCPVASFMGAVAADAVFKWVWPARALERTPAYPVGLCVRRS